jgi:CubicO group peptidase (beta-lactamase class C family)
MKPLNLFSLIFTSLWGLVAQTDASPLPQGSWLDHGLEKAQKIAIRQAFQRGIDEQFIPGGSLMILHKGEVILQEGFGVADLESRKPFEANMPCRIASLTKPHTTTTLALLAEEGKLAFSDYDLDLIVIILTQVPQAQTNKWRGPLLQTVFDVFETGIIRS